MLTRQVVSLEGLQSLKNILKRNVKPEHPKKIIAGHKIEIYKKGKLQGVLFITAAKEDPFVNFKNENVDFGFRLTNGIGMSL